MTVRNSEKLIDHIDLRVRDIEQAAAFYDALMASLGLKRINKTGAPMVLYGHPDGSQPCFAIIADKPDHRGNDTCIAFAADTKEDVDKAAGAIRNAGAAAIEGPDFCPEYSPTYYAVFFEDLDGNRLEVCCRTATP